MARKLFEVVFCNFPDKCSPAFASATDLSGLIYLNMQEPSKAMEQFRPALLHRQEILSSDDSFITWGFNNIALAYTELENLKEQTPRTRRLLPCASALTATGLEIYIAIFPAFGFEWVNLTRLLKRH